MSREVTNHLNDAEKRALRVLISDFGALEEAKSHLINAQNDYREACLNLSTALHTPADDEGTASFIPESLVINLFDYVWLVRVDYEGDHQHTVEMLGGIATL